MNIPSCAECSTALLPLTKKKNFRQKVSGPFLQIMQTIPPSKFLRREENELAKNDLWAPKVKCRARFSPADGLWTAKEQEKCDWMTNKF